MGIETEYGISSSSARGAVDPGAGLLLGIADPATRPGPDRSYDEAWLPTLRAAARRCTPGLVDLPVRSGWAGLYEMTPDHDALLGTRTIVQDE